MAFDFKTAYKDLYKPGTAPSIINVPAMNFLAVRGQGDPNETDGAYTTAIELLYGVAYTLKMSYKGTHRIPGYYEYVVPPLEGFWWQEDAATGETLAGMDYTRKADFHWISVIRLPEFVTREEFNWAVAEATAKKKRDFSAVEFLTLDEGLCVQCLHVGPFDDEPATVAAMQTYVAKQGLAEDFSATRMHHEIYLSDPRKSAPEKLKTVIRHPVRKEI